MLATPASVIELDDDDGYGRQADEIIARVWQMFQDKDAWTSESKGSSGLDVIVAKTYPKWGKVFRLTVINTNMLRKKHGMRSNFLEYFECVSRGTCRNAVR